MGLLLGDTGLLLVLVLLVFTFGVLVVVLTVLPELNTPWFNTLMILPPTSTPRLLCELGSGVSTLLSPCNGPPLLPLPELLLSAVQRGRSAHAQLCCCSAAQRPLLQSRCEQSVRAYARQRAAARCAACRTAAPAGAISQYGVVARRVAALQQRLRAARRAAAGHAAPRC